MYIEQAVPLIGFLHPILQDMSLCALSFTNIFISVDIFPQNQLFLLLVCEMYSWKKQFEAWCQIQLQVYIMYIDLHLHFAPLMFSILYTHRILFIVQPFSGFNVAQLV